MKNLQIGPKAHAHCTPPFPIRMRGAVMSGAMAALGRWPVGNCAYRGPARWRVKARLNLAILSERLHVAVTEEASV